MPKVARLPASKAVKEIHTPNVHTIDELAAFLKVDQTVLAKSLVYRHNGKPLLILMLGNDQLNESKLSSALGGGEFRAMDAEELKSLTGADAGSIGPIGLRGFRIIADKRLEGGNGLVSGANRNDYHIGNIDLQRDVVIDGYYDLRTVEAGETCSSCGSALKISNAIELGHIFKLGTKYADALNVTYLDESGQAKPVIMGSYGIGIERIIACSIEQNHDADGIIWDKSLAPYLAHVIAINMNNKDIVLTSNQVYKSLNEAGIEAIFDDRATVSPGFKFKDADLLGMPVQVIIGEKGLKNNQVELKVRRTRERTMVPIDDLIPSVKKLLAV
jgi:prolyl-tRNA synthetase